MALRLDAYYYGFESTGNDAVDKILSAVACAGKAFHNTIDWNDEVGDQLSKHFDLEGETPREWIQNAANDLAKLLSPKPMFSEEDYTRGYKNIGNITVGLGTIEVPSSLIISSNLDIR